MYIPTFRSSLNRYHKQIAITFRDIIIDQERSWVAVVERDGRRWEPSSGHGKIAMGKNAKAARTLSCGSGRSHGRTITPVGSVRQSCLAGPWKERLRGEVEEEKKNPLMIENEDEGASLISRRSL